MPLFLLGIARNLIEPRDYHLLREPISVPTCVIPNLFLAQEAIFIKRPGPRIFIVIFIITIIIIIIIIDYDYDYNYDDYDDDDDDDDNYNYNYNFAVCSDNNEKLIQFLKGKAPNQD